jgi:hypothetical protein
MTKQCRFIYSEGKKYIFRGIKMKDKEEQALKDFLINIDCLKQLDDWTDDFNLFDVLKITNMEIRHSNILSWIFDPNESHGLGDSFIKSFITKVASKCDPNKYNLFDLLIQNFYSYQVYRESNHMDIVLASYEEKTAVIIENKIWSGESTHQLSNYLEKSKTEYKDFNQILYVFLTPCGKEASDPDNWMTFSYGEIIDSLESSIKGMDLRNEVALLIHNYIDIVRKNIMKEKDEKLVKICNEIYNNHKTSLQLIFENVKIDYSIENEIICNTLKELNDSGQIIFKDENKWQFFTASMNTYLPALETMESSWGTNWIYYYWFEKYDDKLIIHFELGGWNLTDELTKRTNALIEASKKKVDEYRYKRLFYEDVKLSQDDYEVSLIDATKLLVKNALQNEKKLLSMVIN